MGVIHTSIFAETTKEDVDNYLEISRGGAVVKDRFLFRYKTYFSVMYGMDIKKADKRTIKKYKSFIFKPKYEDIFYEAFTQLDDNTYFEIMEFYKTKLGKKYAQAFKELYAMDISKELMLSIMENKDSLLLPEKRKLVTEINRVLYSQLHIDLEKGIFVVGYNKKMENKKISKSTKELKTLLDEYIEVFNEIAYRCFSDEELSQVLKYAKTYGKIEMGFLHHALKLNIDYFKKDLDDFMEKEKLSKTK